jgi:hypothetical protein
MLATPEQPNTSTLLGQAATLSAQHMLRRDKPLVNQTVFNWLALDAKMSLQVTRSHRATALSNEL